MLHAGIMRKRRSDEADVRATERPTTDKHWLGAKVNQIVKTLINHAAFFSLLIILIERCATLTPPGQVSGSHGGGAGNIKQFLATSMISGSSHNEMSSRSTGIMAGFSLS